MVVSGVVVGIVVCSVGVCDGVGVSDDVLGMGVVVLGVIVVVPLHLS